MKLSILIPTLHERHAYLDRLQRVLLPQVELYTGQVEVRYHDAGRAMKIGQKRNELLDQAEGDYACFVDDDDQVSANYLSRIMKALESEPDCVTFNGWMTTDGDNSRDFVIRLGSKYEEREKVYYRFPNHLCPMKRERVKDVRFPNVHMAEDYAYAKEINDRRLLKSSIHITDKLYHYDYVTYKVPYGWGGHR